MTLDFRSYQNHILHSAVYTAIIACAIPKKDDNKSTVVTAGGYFIAALAAVALQSEIRYAIRRRRMPPGDSGYPILGHFIPSIKDPEAFSVSLIEKYGPILTYNLLMSQTVMLTDEEDVRWAATQERKGVLKALMLEHHKRLIGEQSILFFGGEQHRRLRKVFEPAFTPAAIRDYASIMDKIAKQTLSKWHASNEFQPPVAWAVLALKVFFHCAFGEVDEDRLQRIVPLFDRWIGGTTSIIPLEIPGTKLATAHFYKKKLRKELKTIIDDFLSKNGPDSPAAESTVMGRLCYAVDEDGHKLTEEQLLDNLGVFLFAGYDTTKGTFCAIAHYLKEFPEAEKHLVEEIASLGGPEKPLDIDQLKKAPVLNAILAEVWRTTAPLMSHAMTATEDIEYKGYHIPKGSFVVTDIQGYNRMNNDLYPRADEFHFVRWLPKDHPLYDKKVANTEEIDYNIMSAKFRSFNVGPHMCLGAHFAKQEVRIVLARLVQSYTLEIKNEVYRPFPFKQLLNEFLSLSNGNSCLGYTTAGSNIADPLAGTYSTIR